MQGRERSAPSLPMRAQVRGDTWPSGEPLAADVTPHLLARLASWRIAVLAADVYLLDTDSVFAADVADLYGRHQHLLVQVLGTVRLPPLARPAEPRSYLGTSWGRAEPGSVFRGLVLPPPRSLMSAVQSAWVAWWFGVELLPLHRPSPFPGPGFGVLLTYVLGALRVPSVAPYGASDDKFRVPVRRLPERTCGPG